MNAARRPMASGGAPATRSRTRPGSACAIEHLEPSRLRAGSPGGWPVRGRAARRGGSAPPRASRRSGRRWSRSGSCTTECTPVVAADPLRERVHVGAARVRRRHADGDLREIKPRLRCHRLGSRAGARVDLSGFRLWKVVYAQNVRSHQLGSIGRTKRSARPPARSDAGIRHAAVHASARRRAHALVEVADRAADAVPRRRPRRPVVRRVELESPEAPRAHDDLDELRELERSRDRR